MHRIRLAHLGLSAILLIVYPAAPTSWQNVLYMVASASAVVAIIVGIRVHRPSSLTPWVLLAAGFALYVAGDLIYTVWELNPGAAPPFPNVSDVSYLLFYPLLFLALARFLRLQAHRDRAAWIDASMWTVAAAALAWEPLIEGYAMDSGSNLAARLVALAYPMLDFALLLMVLRMIAGRRRVLRPAFLLLSTGMLLLTLTDILYAAQVLDGTFVDGSAVDLGWLLTYIAIGAAALHPSMVELTKPSRQIDAVSSRWRLATLGGACLVAPCLLLVEMLSGDTTVQQQDIVAVASAMTILLMLGVARSSGLVAIAERRAAELAARQGQLEQVMADRERIIDKLNRRIGYDTLTGLSSRDRFVEGLEARLASGRPPSVAFLDLDDFKTINDTLGHDAGDSVLRDLAVRLRAAVGPEDQVARFGGDEFAVLFGGDVEQCAERMLDALQPPFVLDGRELRLSVSIGITTAKSGGSEVGDLLREADVAMYTAKRNGGGWARYRTGMSALLLQRMDLRTQLVDAIRDGEIVPWFQPVVDLATGRLLGFEALARWGTGDQLVRDPSSWLPLAEETGLIVSVDRAMLRAALTQFARWRTRFPTENLRLAVNLSARTLHRRGIAEEILEALAELDVPPDRLTVEVTEGVLLEDVSARLQLLRAAGVKVALDDFGTGWSSLSYLQRFPVDQLKLDQTFTAELETANGEAIPAAVLQLAQALQLDVVVEGVETTKQRDRLLELGFRTGQGYLFNSALPALFAETMLEPTARPLALVG